jgi:SAM-dependent methyltransferase
MDEISKINRLRWNNLADAQVEYSRPFLSFTIEDAKKYVYRHGILKDVAGKQVLCLASGGGQDSVAFGLLGADVTVLDLSDVQLERDRQAAAYHGLQTKTIQGDMRDLSAFPDNHFDLVWQVYSINFVPSVMPVIREVRRILKPGGMYFLQFANPFAIGIDEAKWDGQAYPLAGLYIDGEDLSGKFPEWDIKQSDASGSVGKTTAIVGEGFGNGGLDGECMRPSHPKHGGVDGFCRDGLRVCRPIQKESGQGSNLVQPLPRER